jgi:hypothetical protein
VGLDAALRSSIEQAVASAGSAATGGSTAPGDVADAVALSQPTLRSTGGLALSPLQDPQLKAAEVKQLLDRASAATASDDAIIAVVDRGGRILGVRVEGGVTAPNAQTLAFMVDSRRRQGTDCGHVFQRRSAASVLEDRSHPAPYALSVSPR